uniref:Uncharacterized protein n=1 Tax=Glossina palpalis gambiensis TaxID=67801 RepID=A0A1B0AX46_9MUSC
LQLQLIGHSLLVGANCDDFKVRNEDCSIVLFILTHLVCVPQALAIYNRTVCLKLMMAIMQRSNTGNPSTLFYINLFLMDV